jgi:Tfp pilus assembly protein PilX
MGRLIHSGQRGFVLFMTLVTLVLMTISGIAMMRAMEAGVSAAGNIAFRQASIRVADIGVEDALQWLLSKSGSTTLQAQANDTDGHIIYYPSVSAAFNPASYDWETGNSHQITDKVSGYDVYYVIHRIAQGTGSCKSATDNAHCQYVPGIGDTGTTAEGTSQAGGSTYAGFITGTSGKVYYRVTVKVSGPRHNVSYVQAFLY